MERKLILSAGSKMAICIVYSPHVAPTGKSIEA